VLDHVVALTWRFTAESEEIWAIAPYGEPVDEANGERWYRQRRAAETGEEGGACVDDVARAVLLALEFDEFEAAATPTDEARSGARMWAQRWARFLRYMQLPDGRFVNFVLDAMGRRNLDGQTSTPGGLWWTGRALWALARYLRVTGDAWALVSWARTPLPDLGTAGKTLGLFTLAGLELLACDPITLAPADAALLADCQEVTRARVATWCEAIVSSISSLGPAYFRDFPGRDGVPLWGYHQLHAVACASMALGRPDFLPACRSTVESLVLPAIRARGWYAHDPVHGGTKEGMCAYCLSPLVQGLEAMWRATGDGTYRALALEGVEWLYGANDAHIRLYDPRTGRCRDGLSGADATVPSDNCGAESSIEAGFMELARRRLAASR
jgi:hypothetical protein